MNKITTYEELLQEKDRLSRQLEGHKSAVNSHIEDIKRQLSPVKNAVRFLSNFTAPPETNTLVGTGLGLTAEVLIRNVLFSKAGWLARLVGPILLKNFSANMIQKNKDTLINKVKSIFHLNGN